MLDPETVIQTFSPRSFFLCFVSRHVSSFLDMPITHDSKVICYYNHVICWAIRFLCFLIPSLFTLCLKCCRFMS